MEFFLIFLRVPQTLPATIRPTARNTVFRLYKPGKIGNPLDGKLLLGSELMKGGITDYFPLKLKEQ